MNYLELNEIEKKQVIEALIFSADEPLSALQIFNLLVIKLSNFNKDNTQNSLQSDNSPQSDDIINSIKDKISEINTELSESNRPYGIIEHNGAYQYAIRPEYGELLQQVSRHKIKKRLSQAALEVLAIIAYKQPISKPEIEQIRGINSNEVVNTLLEKNFIEITGKSENIGRSLLYSTTDEFLKVFGMNSILELPKLKEFDELSNFDNINSNTIDASSLIASQDVLESELDYIKVIKAEDIIYKKYDNMKND